MGNKLLSFVALIACSIASFAHAQDCVPWELRGIDGPLARSGHCMAFDEARDRVVLFGGYIDAPSNREPRSDTWLWDSQGWSPANVTGPSARFGAAMAYDSTRGRVVLFGGATISNQRLQRLGDTWEWDGRAWRQVATTGPSSRYGHALAYDSVRGRVVLFGGLTSTGPRDQDTWEWNGTAWTRVTQLGPPFRYGHAMAYDASRGRVVLFGGYGTPEPNKDYLADTWEWNGTLWTRVATTGPSPRFHHSITYDAKRRRTIVLGGRRGGQYLGDAWEWNGSAWRSVSSTGQLARDQSGMVFDVTRGRAVVFGGFTPDFGRLADTWVQGAALSPVFSVEPAPVVATVGSRVSLGGDATGAGPLTFQWRRDGEPIAVNAPRFTGVRSDTLVIDPFLEQDAGVYDLVVENSCGSATSRGVALGNAFCPADVDDGTRSGARDGAVTVDDLLFYLDAFRDGRPGADVDDGNGTGRRDGGVTVEDLVFFLLRFESGC